MTGTCKAKRDYASTIASRRGFDTPTKCPENRDRSMTVHEKIKESFFGEAGEEEGATASIGEANEGAC